MEKGLWTLPAHDINIIFVHVPWELKNKKPGFSFNSVGGSTSFKSISSIEFDISSTENEMLQWKR